MSRRPKSVLGSRRTNDDVDLSHRLDRLPDTDIARFHHKAVAGAKNARLLAFLGQLHHAGKDVAVLEGLALDRAVLARRASQTPVFTESPREESCSQVL